MSKKHSNQKRGISARIDPELYRKTRVYVIEHGMSYEEWIERAMDRYYEECTGGVDEAADALEGRNIEQADEKEIFA